MRKFLLSPSVWMAAFGAVGVIQTTRNGPRDWRLILAWVNLGTSLTLAVGTVLEKSHAVDREIED